MKMSEKLTYKELEQRVIELEKEKIESNQEKKRPAGGAAAKH